MLCGSGGWRGAGKDSLAAGLQLCSLLTPVAVRVFGAGWMLILTFAIEHSDKNNFNFSAPWLFSFLKQDTDHFLSLVFPDLVLLP